MYHSTRSKDVQADSRQAILQGLAPDGGLYVSDELPQIDLDRILSQDYQQNALYILGALLPEYEQAELIDSLNKAYGNTFASKDITPLVPVGDHHVLELFHGPTSAFKDVALCLLPQLMSRALEKEGEKALILTATSGDTGKAALSGFQDADNIGIAVFFPEGKVSAIQQKQMTSQPGQNVAVAAVAGNFDDAQTMVKNLFLDEDLAKTAAEKGVRLSSANSINVGRLVPQIVYYFEAYKQLVQKGAIKKGQEVIFSVPTGNFGDVLAGYYAYLMGLPVKKFIVASNANHILSDFLKTGQYDTNRPFIKTISPSMDILISSNLERLLYYMSGQNPEQIAKWMKDLKETGSYQIDDKTLGKIQDLFEWDWSDDDRTRQTIDEVFKETGYVLDPHSAVAYRAALKENEPVIVLSTASPYKFPQDVLQAMNIEEKDEWKALDKLSELNAQPIPAGLAALKEAPVLHETSLSKDEMKGFVLEALERLL